MEKNKKPLLDLNYYDPRSVEKQSFLMIPAIMLPLPDYDSNEWDNPISRLSSDVKILYVIMRNRMMASYQDSNLHQFTDSDGHVFIIMKLEEIMLRLHVSKPTAVKLIAILEETGLIRVSRAKNKLTNKNIPNKYYIMDVNSLYSDLQAKHLDSESQVKNIDLENQVKKIDLESRVKKFDPENQVKKIDRRLESISSAMQVKIINNRNNNSNTEENRKKAACEYLMNRVEYGRFIEFVYSFQPLEIADEIKTLAESLLSVMGEIITADKKYYNISGNRIPTSELVSIVRSADYEWFSKIVTKMTQTPAKVKNGKAYTRAIIYNSQEDSLDGLSGTAGMIKYYIDGGRK